MKVMSAVARGVIKCMGFKHDVPTSAHHTEAGDDIDSELSPLSIPEDYKSLISYCFRSVGLTEDHVSISVHPVGQRPSGLEIYAAFVKVMCRDSSTTTLLNEMPHIEKMIDRGIRRSDMPRYSSFAGLWFQSSPEQGGSSATMH
ncbi:hypothetical protein [Hydrogenophaga sp. BPS33]|uniref:hypothetical protein n=1 Tax=Hydrogenophaga sp. BPS33 TaxID=2651974 RepID=UPI00131F7150|nr:hypothetical protein [Hydrogenophaga sp. BPS33]QHE88316.1 hypothetical protein F9K07_27270 [Hydrogenophaga sp. BPS33]